MISNVLAIAASFACLVEARSFLVDEGSRYAVSHIASYHATGVPAASASSVAGKLIGEFLDAPPMSAYVSEALNAFAADGGQLTDDDMKKLAQDFAASYSAFSQGADYAPFTSYFKANSQSFDIAAVFTSAIEGANSNSASIESYYKSLNANPSGHAAITALSPVVTQFANDMGMGKYLTAAQSSLSIKP